MITNRTGNRTTVVTWIRTMIGTEIRTGIGAILRLGLDYDWDQDLSSTAKQTTWLCRIDTCTFLPPHGSCSCCLGLAMMKPILPSHRSVLVNDVKSGRCTSDGINQQIVCVVVAEGLSRLPPPIIRVGVCVYVREKETPPPHRVHGTLLMRLECLF